MRDREADSEVSAFNHAFRRWVGQSPGDYRRRRAARSA
jgi:AraC-like DNA-binding protein